MAIRGSEWKNQELAELLQGIFSFVFIFISEIGSQRDAQQAVENKWDRELSKARILGYMVLMVIYLPVVTVS